MVEYLTLIQARISSSRLPAKVMLDLDGKTLLERVVESASASHRSHKIVVATSNESTDDIIEQKMSDAGIDVFRGDLSNVLKRFYGAACQYKAQNIVRLTADNPFNGFLIDKLIETFELDSTNDYAMFSNGIYGLSPEVISFDALEQAYYNATDPSDLEHLTGYIKRELKAILPEIDPKYRFPQIRATVDVLEDYIFMQNFFLFCKKNALNPTLHEYINYYHKECEC